MQSSADPSRQDKTISGAFALGMHVLFLALLIFGVTWQKKLEPQANIVDLWASLPPQAQPKVQPPPPPQAQPVDLPPVKAAPKPEVAKPDIAMKEKAAREKAEKEKAEKEKAEKERRQLREKQIAARKREEQAKAEQKKQEENEAAERAAKAKIAAQQAAELASLRNEYIERIRARIKRFVVLPPNIQGNPETEFDVVLLPGGEVLSARLKRASGNAAYDNAVERAILKAQPLPLPPDAALFRDFRELNLKFRPQE